MFLLEDLDDDLKFEFHKLGIQEEDEMLAICLGLDAIAEIGYEVYKNNNSEKDNIHDKASESKVVAGGEDHSKAFGVGKDRKGRGNMDKGIKCRPIQA